MTLAPRGRPAARSDRVPPDPKHDLRLSPDDLPEVVEEAAHLAADRENTLDRERVREVLAEVDLPADLVDEAHDRVLAKRAAAREQTRRRWLLGTFVAGGLAFAGAVAFSAQSRATLVAGVTAQHGRLSLGPQGPDVAAFRAADRPDLTYTVTLANAPTGRTLDVRCDFRDPTGTVARQITYTTKTITTPVWDTHCHYSLPTSSPPGTWSVELSVENKALRRESFRVD
jgi:hypothetical protein